MGGGIDLCARRLFRLKFNYKQPLLEYFFDVMRSLGSTESQSESNFPFLCKRVQETKDEYYKMLLKISTHLVGYCLLTYFRDEIATVAS